MKWIACLLIACGCQHGGDGAKAKPPVDSAYREDITNLCDVLHLSEADKLPEGDRAPTIAMWLGPHIKTDAGRDFLVTIQPLVGEAKATALDAEARRVGLPSCALAAEWRH